MMGKASDVSSTASELVVMAAQVRDHAQAALHRSALAHAAGEVIRTHGEATVLMAIELAPNLQVARTIRHAAETACEAVSTRGNGVERHARLFSIALAVQFGEPLTTREFGDRLAPVLGTGSLLARVQECGTHQPVRSFIWPHGWAFDDLSRLSLGDVRRWTIMANAASATANMMPSTPSVSVQRCCPSFLRYLVGYQVGTDATHEHDSRRFADCVRSVLWASLPDAQDIAVAYDGCFYGPLWDGLRAYQGYRIADVVAAMGGRGITASELVASVALIRRRNQLSAQIAFLRGRRKLDQFVYHIALQPQADPTTTIAHIVAPLRGLGVKVHITRQGTASCRGERSRLHHKSRAAPCLDRFEFGLPL